MDIKDFIEKLLHERRKLDEIIASLEQLDRSTPAPTESIKGQSKTKRK
jgi:hypothetical protein